MAIMSTSALEKELLKATSLLQPRKDEKTGKKIEDVHPLKNLKQGTTKRQPFLVKLKDAIGDLDNDDWDTISEAGKVWTNKATKEDNKNIPITDFPPDEDREPERETRSSRGSRDRDSDRGDRDDSDKGGDKEEQRSSRRGRDDDGDKGGKGKDEEASDTRGSRRRERAPEPEPRAGKGKADAKKGGKETEERAASPSRRSSAADAGDEKPLEGAKVNIKRLIMEDFGISVADIVTKLNKKGSKFPTTAVTVSNIRADFRHSLKLLKQDGKLKGIEF